MTVSEQFDRLVALIEGRFSREASSVGCAAADLKSWRSCRGSDGGRAEGARPQEAFPDAAC
jgi:hypothetical protein